LVGLTVLSGNEDKISNIPNVASTTAPAKIISCMRLKKSIGSMSLLIFMTRYISAAINDINSMIILLPQRIIVK